MNWNRKGEDNILQERMLEGVTVLQFPGLSTCECCNHLFTTRMGGVSEGIWASMNLSYSRGDDPCAVDENFRRIASCFGKTPEHFVLSDQTHTTNIRFVTSDDMGKGTVREKDYTDIDGLITDTAGIILGTFFADCVPLYFVDPVHRAIGLAHSGWRGTAGRMGNCMVKAMGAEFGSRPEELMAAIGPSICLDCYEVSKDVADVFLTMFSEEPVPTDNREENTVVRLGRLIPETGEQKYQLNLWEANRRILVEAGIPNSQIEVTDLCTCCNSKLLFSHRASMGKRGNLGAFLMLN